MHHRVEALAVDRRAEGLRIRHIGDAERDIRREVGAIACGDVVHNDDEIATLLERVDDRAADESGAAGHEYAHLPGAPSFHNCGQLLVWITVASEGKEVDGRDAVLGIVS